MKHESFVKKIDTSETNVSFEKIYQKDWFPTELIDEIKEANFLIIPTDYLSDSKDAIFPETTTEFFNYIRGNSKNQLHPDIAISDENFKKVEKHSALVEIATFIVTDIALPIAIGLLSAYLYDLAKKYRRKPEELSAKVNILVEEEGKKKTTRIEYEGPVSGIKESLEKVADGIGSKND